MHVIEVMEKKHSPLISQENEEALTFLESFPISQMNADLNEIRKNYRIMQKAIQSQTSAPQDSIKAKLEGFVSKIEERVAKIEIDIK